MENAVGAHGAAGKLAARDRGQAQSALQDESRSFGTREALSDPDTLPTRCRHTSDTLPPTHPDTLPTHHSDTPPTHFRHASLPFFAPFSRSSETIFPAPYAGRKSAVVKKHADTPPTRLRHTPDTRPKHRATRFRHVCTPFRVRFITRCRHVFETVPKHPRNVCTPFRLRLITRYGHGRGHTKN